MRSWPPPWMSSGWPRYLSDMAEHSMCQPGRPLPPPRLDAGAREHGIEVAGGQLAVVRLAPHTEVDVAVGLVGVAALDEALDHLDDGGDLVGGAGVDVRLLDVERRHVLEELLDVLLRHLVDGEPFGAGAVEDVVLDIGEVLDVADFDAAVLQVAAGGIEDDVDHGVADVAGGGEVRPANGTLYPLA